MATVSGGLVALGVGHSAQAAPVRIQFNIPPKPYQEALLDLAQQANITLIGAAECDGAISRNALSSALPLDEALDRLLAGAPCAWKQVAPGTVQIVPVPRAAAKPAPPTVVSELLVTATKRVRDPRQLAVGVTAVSGRDLHAIGANDVDDAAGQLAGVLATNLGPGRDKLLLRGLSDGAFTGRARSTVATYLDDMPINYNAPDPDLRLTDVERVEVARGPQGALYGAGSMSGIYRIVSRKPDLEGFASEVRATGALTASGAPSEAVEGYVNAPLWGVGTRLSGYYEIQGGYLDDINLKRRNADRTERWGGRLTSFVQLSPNWSALVTVAGQHLGSDDTHYTTPGMGLTRANRILEPHTNDIALATSTIKGSWDWGEFTSISGIVSHKYGSLYDATAVQSFYASEAVTSAYSERTSTRMLVEDLYLASRGGGRFQWLAGLYGSITQEHSPTAFLAQVPGQPDNPVYGDDRRDRIRELAAYAELSYEFAPRWTVALGGRVFNLQTHTQSRVVSGFLPRDLDRVAMSGGLSPKLSIQRQFGTGDLIYAVMSEGYRGGGFNSGGTIPLSVARETYRPDHLRNFEIGVKLDAMGRRLQSNTAVFYDVWDDIQTDQFRLFGIPYTTNAGGAHILGLETELAYHWENGLSAQANGRLSRVRTVHPNPDFATRLTDGLPGAPAISGTLLLAYQRDIFGGWRMRLEGETTYVGRSRVTFDTTFPPMGGYYLTRFSAGLSRSNLGLLVFLTNPSNDFSDTFAYGNPFNPGFSRQITPQRPRTIGVTLSASR